jgi:peptidoglycan/xylan/chitin deacetylase (PgdA/CDA1 family)
MARVTVLMYHMISDPITKTDRRFTCPTPTFRSHLEHLKRSGVNVVGLDRVLAHISGDEIDRDAVAITFDDGYRDNYENAFPLLREFGFPATIFLVTSTMGGTNRWMADREFSQRPMMDWRAAAEVAAAGITLGGHTVTHPRLTSLKIDKIRSEVGDCAKIIADRTGYAVEQFAYPYGVLDAVVRDIVAESGYRLACSTRSGFNAAGTDPFEIRRLEVMGGDGVGALKRKMNLGTNDGSYRHMLRYYLRRVRARLTA